MGDWSTWSGCDDCVGIGVRTRSVAQQADSEGIECLDLQVETASCAFILNCDDPSCQYTPWSTWSSCPTTCYHGLNCASLPTQFRMRSIARPALRGGRPCDWTTLLETATCLPTAACASDTACIAAPSSPSDCIPCPSSGCTVTEPFYTFCTRSILVTQSGNGAPCSAEQLIYSQTCPLPQCTEECLASDYSAFSTCSVPCGDGWFISSVTCPSVTTEQCNFGTCPIGTMVYQASSCTMITSTVCDSLPDCLAKCASDPFCDTVYSETSLVKGSATCVPGPYDTWRWDPLSTACVSPTWEMVNATCLYLCDTSASSFSTQRGLVFHFNSGTSLSCPVTPHLLASSGACPIQGSFSSTPTIIEMLATAVSVDRIQSFTDPFDMQVYTLTCPASGDCVYQAWNDAPVWSQCTGGCVGGGTRHRSRAIVQPAYFLGVPCDPYEQIEYAPCNIGNAYATGMSCSGAIAGYTASDVICHEKFSATSLQIFKKSFSSHAPEVYIFNAGTILTSMTIEATVTSILASLPGTRLANYADLKTAYDKGFQACTWAWAGFQSVSQQPLSTTTSSIECPFYTSAPWKVYDVTSNTLECTYTFATDTHYDTPALTCRPGFTLTGLSCTSTPCAYPTVFNGSCVPLDSQYTPESSADTYSVALVSHQSVSSCPYNGVHVKQSQSQYIFLYGIKPPTSQPFFTPFKSSSLGFSLSLQQYADENVCYIMESRTDALLSLQKCFPLGNFASSSALYDLPCEATRDCSYTSWTRYTSCGSCIPPATRLETRSVARQPSEGGAPCTAPLMRTVDCGGPACSTNTEVCLYNPFPSYGCDSSKYPPRPYISEWSTNSVLGYTAYNISNMLPALSVNADGVAIALNAQCGPQLCVPSVTVNGLVNGLGQAYEMDIEQNVAMGWTISNCIVSTSFSQCLTRRLEEAPANFTTGSYVFDGAWRTVSMCPYEPSCCVWGPCGTCSPDSSGSSTQHATATRRLGTCLDETITQQCGSNLPSCATSASCPVGFDGTPCSSLSGWGLCVLSASSPVDFYACSCTLGHSGRACDGGCPVAENAQTCSGNGICESATELCSCFPPWGGPLCDQLGPSAYGVVELLLENATMKFDWENNPTINVTISNPLPCDSENNPVCADTYINSNNAPPNFTPFRMLVDNLNDFAFSNICVNASDIGWVPSAGLPLTSEKICSSLGISIPAQFTSHTSVPSHLQGLKFYTSCNSQSFLVAGNFLRQHIPCQFAGTCETGTAASQLFRLLGYEGTLQEYCARAR